MVLALVALALTQAAAEAVTPRPVPVAGNEPCRYPEAAQRVFVTGAVRYTAQVTPAGAVASVQIRSVPQPELGFEDAVRDCVSAWRFQPAPDAAEARPFESLARFSVKADEEEEVRTLMTRLAEAWSSGRSKEVGELEASGRELAAFQQKNGFLHHHILATGGEPGCQRALDPDLGYIRFLAPNLVEARQWFACRTAEGPAGDAVALDVMALKGKQDWRFVTMNDELKRWFTAFRAGVVVPEPKLVKHVPPQYPEIARQARVQGSVSLDCLISPEGAVVGTRVLKGIPLMDQAAIDAVRQWVYEPTVVNGHPAWVVLTVPVRFLLK